MKKRALFLFLVSLTLSSCGEESVPDTRHYDEVTFKAAMVYQSKDKSLELEYKYSDRHFYKSSYSYDKELAILSLGLADYIAYPDRALDTFEKIGYKNVYSSDYSVNSDIEDHIAFSFAYKIMNDTDCVISIAVRGFDYGNEWASNMHIGESGNHRGFDVASDTVIEGLDEYVETYKEELSDKTIKLWMYGFSRGGATAGLTASKLIDRIDERKSPFNLIKDNIYCYTFESPLNIATSNTKEYKNIHNIINPNDLIVKVPPTSYGFKRTGIDHYLDVSNIKEKVKAFDKKLVYQEFKEKQVSLSLSNLGYADVKNSEHNHAKFNDYFIEILTAPDESGEYPDVSTRLNYCNNFEFGLSYILRCLFSKGLYDAGPIFTTMFNDNIMIFVNALLLGKVSSLYNAFSSTFNQFEVSYDKEALQLACYQFEELLSYVVHDVSHFYDPKAIAFATLSYNSNLIVQMHSPEFIMALLK